MVTKTNGNGRQLTTASTATPPQAAGGQLMTIEEQKALIDAKQMLAQVRQQMIAQTLQQTQGLAIAAGQEGLSVNRAIEFAPASGVTAHDKGRIVVRIYPDPVD